MKPRIYLDNSATTRIDDEVLDAMLPYLRERFGNASSIHAFGQEARAAVEDARQAVADLVGAEPRELVFTSGGTESDNMALWGVLRSGYRPGNHIITSRIEHPAVLATCKALEEAGAEVTFLPVDSSGRVDPERVTAAVNERTILITIMHANNETGVIQPIEEIGRIARERGILLHTDAVQSVGKIPVHVGRLGVDLLSLSGHKFHGPKGAGALYVRAGVKLKPLLTGGSHERRRRAGTENVAALVGLGAASRLAQRRLPAMTSRVAVLRDRLQERIRNGIPGVRINGSVEHRLPMVTNMAFDALEGEAAVIALDLAGVAVSTGSACSSGSLEPSHVLMGMGLRAEVVQGSLRFSLSHHSAAEEIDGAAQIVVDTVTRLRGLARRG